MSNNITAEISVVGNIDNVTRAFHKVEGEYKKLKSTVSGQLVVDAKGSVIVDMSSLQKAQAEIKALKERLSEIEKSRVTKVSSDVDDTKVSLFEKLLNKISSTFTAKVGAKVDDSKVTGLKKTLDKIEGGKTVAKVETQVNESSLQKLKRRLTQFGKEVSKSFQKGADFIDDLGKGPVGTVGTFAGGLLAAASTNTYMNLKDKNTQLQMLMHKVIDLSGGTLKGKELRDLDIWGEKVFSKDNAELMRRSGLTSEQAFVNYAGLMMTYKEMGKNLNDLNNDTTGQMMKVESIVTAGYNHDQIFDSMKILNEMFKKDGIKVSGDELLGILHGTVLSQGKKDVKKELLETIIEYGKLLQDGGMTTTDLLTFIDKVPTTEYGVDKSVDILKETGMFLGKTGALQRGEDGLGSKNIKFLSEHLGVNLDGEYEKLKKGKDSSGKSYTSLDFSANIVSLIETRIKQGLLTKETARNILSDSEGLSIVMSEDVSFEHFSKIIKQAKGHRDKGDKKNWMNSEDLSPTSETGLLKQKVGVSNDSLIAKKHYSDTRKTVGEEEVTDFFNLDNLSKKGQSVYRNQQTLDAFVRSSDVFHHSTKQFHDSITLLVKETEKRYGVHNSDIRGENFRNATLNSTYYKKKITREELLGVTYIDLLSKDEKSVQKALIDGYKLRGKSDKEAIALSNSLIKDAKKTIGSEQSVKSTNVVINNTYNSESLKTQQQNSTLKTGTTVNSKK